MSAVCIPKYRHYKPKDLAVVRLDGRDVYLGKHGSAESWAKYHQLVADWLAGRPLDVPAPRGQVEPVNSEPDLTVAAMVGAFRGYAESYYVADGKLTKEVEDLKYSARPLVNITVVTGQVGGRAPRVMSWQRRAVAWGARRQVDQANAAGTLGVCVSSSRTSRRRTSGTVSGISSRSG